MLISQQGRASPFPHDNGQRELSFPLPRPRGALCPVPHSPLHSLSPRTWPRPLVPITCLVLSGMRFETPALRGPSILTGPTVSGRLSS